MFVNDKTDHNNFFTHRSPKLPDVSLILNITLINIYQEYKDWLNKFIIIFKKRPIVIFFIIPIFFLNMMNFNFNHIKKDNYWAFFQFLYYKYSFFTCDSSIFSENIFLIIFEFMIFFSEFFVHCVVWTNWVIRIVLELKWER